VTALVPLTAAVSTWIRPASTRTAGLAGPAFALLGTLIGVFTIAVSVGPRTAPDILYHIAMIWGLIITKRT
jgi:hypothetical protein